MAFCGTCGTSLADSPFCTNCGTPAGTPQALAQSSAAPAEQTLFDHGGIFISNVRFVAGAQTYAMSGVTSIGTSVEHPSKMGPILAILFGAFVAFCGLIAIAHGGIVAILIGGAIIALGVMVFKKRLPTFFVLLRSASGEQRATSSKDQTLIQQIVAALNQAILIRG